MKAALLVKLILAAVIFALATSCQKKTDDSIQIGILRGPSAVSFAQMMSDPPKIDGKQIEFIIKNDPQQIQAMLLKNELEFAVLPTVMAANMYNKGLKYRMVACPIWGTLYILSNNADIKSIKDLKYGKISVFGQGATPDILLQYFLEKNNIKNLNTEYTYTNNTDLSMALLSKKVQTAVISEPLASMILNKDKSVHIVSKLDFKQFVINSDKDIFVQTAFLANNDFAIEFPTIMHLICEAYSSSCNFVNEHPTETGNLLVQQKIVPNTKVAKVSLPLCNIRYVASFAIESEINSYLKIFMDQNPKVIGNKMPDRNFIYQPQ